MLVRLAPSHLEAVYDYAVLLALLFFIYFFAIFTYIYL